MIGLVLLLSTAGSAVAAPTVNVFPSPGTRAAEPFSQISFRGSTASSIGTVRVVGSRSGQHAGVLAPHSDGGGASFLPKVAFTPGETVTVSTALNVLGGQNGSFHFQVVTPAGTIKPLPLPLVPAGRNGIQRFRSRPDLLPAAVTVTRRSTRAAPGDIFVAPQAGPIQNGPMLLDAGGGLVWFHPLPRGQTATDFRTQTLGGQPVLTWWQGVINNGSGRGDDVIFDQRYRQIATVRAANGFQGADLHDFQLTPAGTAYIIVASPVRWPGTRKPLMDSVIQEIDIKTGLVLFEWHALDHVPVSESYFRVTSQGHVFDPYHLNSVAVDHDGNPIISMRNTWALYKLDHRTGAVIWTLGSNRSSFKLGPGVAPAFQHNFVVQPDGTYTLFDDGAGPPVRHSHSRAIRISINTKTRTASLVKEYNHSPALISNFEGGAQLLPGGDLFVGYGQQPYFSEFDPAGRLIFDAHFNAPTPNYRAYRFPWDSQPPTSPDVALDRGANGVSTLYASWNGATNVASWRLLAGLTPGSLSTFAVLPKRGFETAMAAHSELPYFAAEALGSAGQVLARSRTVGASGTRLSIFGSSAFVRGGFGGVSAGCFSASVCRIAATVSTGRTVLARTGRQLIGPNTGGTVFFSLSPAGRSLLARAPRGHLGVSVRLTNADGASTTSGMNLVSYGTSGSAPATSVSQSTSLRILARSAFVSPSGLAGLFVACASAAPCHAATTVSIGKLVIARAGSEYVGGQDLGTLFFKLSGAGLSALARAKGNQLPVQVTATNGSDRATARIVLTRFR